MSVSIQEEPLVEKVSDQNQDDSYPEGGLRAWLVVFGSFCGCVVAFGFANTVGVFQTYLSEHQLAAYSNSSIGWIFSVNVFLCFILGIQIGPLFDLKGPRWLVLLGSILTVASIFLLPHCTEYWHYMLDIGILAGTGSALLFTPCIAAVSHFFLERRGAATGLAATGGAVGGIIFPLMLQALLPKVGWSWSLRILGSILILLCIFANLLVRGRLQPKRVSKSSEYFPNLKILRDPAFAFTVGGVFCMEWGLFIPLAYISSFIVDSGTATESFAFKVLAILNAGSVLGRITPGFVADKFGRFNTIIALLFLCLLTTLTLWLTASLLPPSTTATKPLVIIYAALFGFASGGNISLVPVCIGQLCRTEEYGRYFATCYVLCSMGALTGIPIGGALIERCGGGYQGIVGFMVGCYVVAFGMCLAARWWRVGWRVREGGKWVKF